MGSFIRHHNLLIAGLVHNALLLVIPAVVWAQFLPGQVIIKFNQGTEGSKAVKNVTQSSSLEFQALTTVIEQLQSETGIPLEVTQVTSGQRIVLSIQSEVLTNRIAKQLNTRPDVAAVEVILPDSVRHPQVPPLNAIVLTFTQDSLESNEILRSTEEASEPCFLKMVSDFEKFIGLPLTGKKYESDKAILQINLKKTTTTLIDRLQLLDHVESAQPNYIMRIR